MNSDVALHPIRLLDRVCNGAPSHFLRLAAKMKAAQAAARAAGSMLWLEDTVPHMACINPSLRAVDVFVSAWSVTCAPDQALILQSSDAF